VHGIQIWVAQALAEESAAPTFVHVAKDDLPSRQAEGATLRLIVGKAFGMQAPIVHSLPMFYLHAQLASQGSIAFDPEYPERAVYAVDTPIRVDGTSVNPGTMGVIDHDQVAQITAQTNATVMLLGGAPLDAPRRLNWNFVASSKELIDAARDSWTRYPNQQFPLVPGETESIPLPTP
jgi:redox-sensitive bicupin YhaK (pirin superfamily)